MSGLCGRTQLCVRSPIFVWKPLTLADMTVRLSVPCLLWGAITPVVVMLLAVITLWRLCMNRSKLRGLLGNSRGREVSKALAERVNQPGVILCLFLSKLFEETFLPFLVYACTTLLDAVTVSLAVVALDPFQAGTHVVSTPLAVRAVALSSSCLIIS